MGNIVDENNFHIKQFEPKYMSSLKKLINDYWNENHILLKSEKLLLWQYEGFGKLKGMHFPLLFDEDKLIGFRGVFPIELQIPQNNSYYYETCSVGSLFLVIPEYRGLKLGLMLQKYTAEFYKGFLAIASNLGTSAPIYKKSGYNVLSNMFRYLKPLTNEYNNLLVSSKTTLKINNAQKEEYMEFPIPFNAKEFSKIWKESTYNKGILALNKNDNFWEWRFNNSPIYDYYYFGGVGTGGLIVVRICDIYDENRNQLKTKTLRFLEIIPEDSSVWDYSSDSRLNRLIKGVLAWGKKNSCCGAEFFTTTRRLEKTLLDSTFLEVNYNEANKNIDIISYFEPTSYAPRLTNVNYLINSSKKLDINFDDVYFSLSDADQDRPNIISK
ncbi:MAG: hypothetical protein RBR97_13430 [Bacteroidales bacterium]|nr:hypothetical protein [Bacteroidales bacterium]